MNYQILWHPDAPEYARVFGPAAPRLCRALEARGMGRAIIGNARDEALLRATASRQEIEAAAKEIVP